MGTKLTYYTAIMFLSKYIRRHKRNFVMFYFGWLFHTVLAIAMPILFGVMIDEIVYHQNLTTFFGISMVFMIMSIYSCLLYFLIYAQHHYLMNMYTLDIKNDVFDHLLKCDAQYMSNAKTGDIIATVQHYSTECMHFVIRNVIHMSNGILMIVAITIYLFIISWQIGLFVLVMAPVTVFINAKFGKKIRGYGNQQRDQYGNYISWAFEILSALRDLRMLGQQKKTENDFEENHRRMFATDVKTSISTLTANNIIEFTSLFVRLSVFTFAGLLALSGNITVGLLIIVVAFYNNLISTIRNVSRSYLDAQNRVSFIQRIHDFIHSPTEDIWSGKNDLVVTRGEIEFRDIKFAYNHGDTVLNELNLHIPAGERFALVGKSGCGKTTLAYMLIGFYRSQRGEIIVDGQRLSDCSLRSIRENIGLIAQDVLLFDGSVRENIQLGNRNATPEEIESACHQAGLWEFLQSLPQGLDTVVGTHGIGLSGGQKQRIAIARIYLKNPRIIIFDEATSALDSDTEETIHKAWESVLHGRTSIVIAHRQSSVMLCDRVAIMEHGRVCEMGVPSQMILGNNAFKTLFAIEEEEAHA